MEEEDNQLHRNYQHHDAATIKIHIPSVNNTIVLTLQGFNRGLIFHPVNGSSCGVSNNNSVYEYEGA